MTEPKNRAQEYAGALQELKEARDARAQLMARFPHSIVDEDGRTIIPGAPVTEELAAELNAAQRRIEATRERVDLLRDLAPEED